MEGLSFPTEVMGCLSSVWGLQQLFRTEVVGRVDEGRTDDAQPNGEETDCKGDQAGQHEDPPGDGNAIGKALQPTAHAQESDWGRNGQGDPRQHHKFLIQ